MIALDCPPTNEEEIREIREAIIGQVIAEIERLWANPQNVMELRSSHDEVCVRTALTVAAEAVRKVGA